MSSCGHMMFITDSENTVYRNERCSNACKRWDDRVLGRNIKIKRYYKTNANVDESNSLDESDFKYYNKQYISIINNEIEKRLSENKKLLIKFFQQNNNIKFDNVLVIQNLLDDNKEIIDNIIYLQKKIQSYENKVYIKENPNKCIFKIQNTIIDKLLSDIKKVTNNINTIKKINHNHDKIRRKLIF
jgi:hypothetical protein